MAETFAEMIKLGDLPIEQKEQILDSIIYSAEHESEFFNEVNKVKLDSNKTSMTFVRAYLPEIDKTSVRYKNGLVEGVTPDPETINEAEFSVNVNENGWYYTFTNKAIQHSWLDIEGRCSKFLQNLFKTYHDEKIADAYLKSANVVSSINLLSLADLLKLSDILYKNGAQDFNGYYKLVVAPEVASAMVVAYKDIITHTTQKEAVVTGEIGEIGGFRVIKSRLQAFKGTAGASSTYNYPFIAYGTTNKGEYAVSTCAYDDMNASIIVTPLGGLGNDPLKQRGSIGLHVDGHGFFVFDDSVCVTGVYNGSATPVSKFADSGRSNLSRTGASGQNIFLNATHLGLSVGGTFVLTATDEDGTALTGTGLVITSDKAAVATATAHTGTVGGQSGVRDGYTITGVKAGTATLKVVYTDASSVAHTTYAEVQVL